MAAGICLIKISILILLEKLPLLIILFCQARDLSIAYFLVALTYIVVGLLFFISFPKEKSCIQEVKCIVGSSIKLGERFLNIVNQLVQWTLLLDGHGVTNQSKLMRKTKNIT